MSYRPSEPILVPGKYSIGLHPCYPEDMTALSLARLRARLDAERPAVWAIGEAGLDKRSIVPLDLQRYYLEEQALLSEELHLPLVLHCVRAFGELQLLYRRMNPRQEWIIHGYRRQASLARQLLSEGFSLSFGEHYDAEALRLAHEAGRMYLETDESLVSIEDLYARAEAVLGRAH